MSKQEQVLLQADPKRWMALALLCLANFMVIMDTSIIGVALPAIKEALGYTQESLQWVFNAYVIFFGGSYYSVADYQTSLDNGACSCGVS